jgi:hypothetical protein
MQNWYSQNRPLKSNAVGVGYGVGIVGAGPEVGLGIAATVAATAWSMRIFGSCLRPHAVTINNKTSNKTRSRMHRLYIQATHAAKRQDGVSEHN